jgi:hypothetical protein
MKSLYDIVKEKYGQKPKQILFNTEMVRAVLEGRKTQTRGLIDVDISNNFDCDPDGTVIAYMNPQTGDMYNPLEIATWQPGDILYIRETFSVDKKRDYVYRTNYGSTEDDSFPPLMFKWHPSIHMPKEAARIFLKVTDVRVEMLQEMRYSDFIAEGMPYEQYEKIIQEKFKILWNKLYEKKGYGWGTNPWVWVIEFERIEVNADS